MKRLSVALLAVSLMVGHVGHANATALQYPPTPEPVASSGGSSKSNVVPITAIVAGVVTLGYVVFKVRKGQQARVARFNIYVAQGQVR